MKKAFAIVSLLAATLALTTLTAPPAFAQGSFAGAPPQNQATFGFTEWAINNQRVASQFAYVIDTRNGLGNNLGLFSFPATTCENALTLPARGGIDPLAIKDGAGALPQVKIVDSTAANSETVTQNSAPSFGGTNGVCSLSLATSNTHSQGSYYLTSPTCGLKEALGDLGGSGTVIVTQEFYALGCSASTITAATGGVAGNFILDISNGQNSLYGWNGTNFSLVQTNSNNHAGFGNTDVIGTLTLASGTKTLTYAKPYTVAPICLVTWNGSGTLTTGASLKCVTTTTTAVITSSTGTDTAVINYRIVANPN